MESASSAAAAPAAARWQPLKPLERRLLGVLIEKSKTTPDAYPMTLNGLAVGASQKSNRAPLMQVEPHELEPALERLRAVGAVALVQGAGRVEKYRHYAYEWLGVDKVELAVMAELLLRGAQTVGELRGRASRMTPIADLAALRPVLHSLAAKGLIVSLTPEGRGHVVSHNLYEPRELERLRADFQAQSAAGVGGADDTGEADEPAPAARRPSPPASRYLDDEPEAGAMAEPRSQDPALATLAGEVADLRAEVSALWQEVRRLEDRLASAGLS